MIGGSIAKRYATALLRIAEQDGKVSEWEQELTQLSHTLATIPEMRNVLETPLIRPEQKKKWWVDVAQRMKLSVALRNLMLTLIDQKRVNLLSLVALIYRDMADDLLGQVRVKVKSAAPLGAYQDQLKAALEKSLKLKVLLEVQEDKGLLGGFVVQVKDRVFDASLINDLKRLQENITKRAVA